MEIDYDDSVISREPIMIGTDPEMFVENEGKLLPAFEFLPSKHEALREDLDSKYFRNETTRVYWDGFQAEWDFAGGVSCIVALMQGNRGAMKLLLQKARAKFPKAKLSLKSVYHIPKEEMDKYDSSFIQLGCMPSFNAYKRNGLQVDDARDFLDRSTGGHKHFACKSLAENQIVPAVKTLDKIAGIWSVGAAVSLDQPIRRKFYGLAGEFRVPKPYIQPYDVAKKPWTRVEWRTPSNFWLCSPSIMCAS